MIISLVTTLKIKLPQDSVTSDVTGTASFYQHSQHGDGDRDSIDLYMVVLQMLHSVMRVLSSQKWPSIFAEVALELTEVSWKW